MAAARSGGFGGGVEWAGNQWWLDRRSVVAARSVAKINIELRALGDEIGDMIAAAIGGKATTPRPGLVASTGSEFLSSLPKLGIVSVPNGASVIYLKSRGNLRFQAVEGWRKTVNVNEKVDDFDDKFDNGHAGQNRSQLSTVGKSTNIKWQDCSVGKIDRQRLLKQKGCVIWITGLSGSGKSTVACALSQFLHQREDRAENIRRIGEVAKLFADAGVICIASLISPYRRDRDACRALLPDGDFIEVFMDVPLQVCEARDSKGLYKLARAGKIKGFTGIDDPYEQPLNCEIVLEHKGGDGASPCVMAEKVVSYLEEKGYLEA
nr:adenylyl-sulfate kinase 1, chloroplastic [Quercus suber]